MENLINLQKCHEKIRKEFQESSCGEGDNQEKIKNTAVGCDRKYQESQEVDLLLEEENSRSQDTAFPLTIEGELQQQKEVIPKGFKNPDQVDGTGTIPHSVVILLFSVLKS